MGKYSQQHNLQQSGKKCHYLGRLFLLGIPDRTKWCQHLNKDCRTLQHKQSQLLHQRRTNSQRDRRSLLHRQWELVCSILNYKCTLTSKVLEDLVCRSSQLGIELPLIGNQQLLLNTRIHQRRELAVKYLRRIGIGWDKLLERTCLAMGSKSQQCKVFALISLLNLDNIQCWLEHRCPSPCWRSIYLLGTLIFKKFVQMAECTRINNSSRFHKWCKCFKRYPHLDCMCLVDKVLA